MTPAARHEAAIAVLADILTRHRPASEALADWGKAHRFAGSGDRNAIGTLVFDVLRKRSSLAWRIGGDTPRDLVLALAAFENGTPEAAARLFAGERFAPQALSADEEARLAAPRSLDDADEPIRGDYPAWLDERLARVYGEGRAGEVAAMSQRAPLDLRVNTLKSDRAHMLAHLAAYGAGPGRFAPAAIRIPAPQGSARAPHIESEAAYQKGQIEIQDEGSQIAALLADARPGMQVADLCAGGGGKTLALAASMENRGQLYAWDADRHRLAPIHQRLERAGVRNCQVLAPGNPAVLEDLQGRLDRVVLDVPCTGSGTWRRRPDAKWRLRETAISVRVSEQDAILHHAARLLKPGGELVYITCSLLAEENEERIAAYLCTEPGRAFAPVDHTARWRRLMGGEPPAQPPAFDHFSGLRLSPKASQTDAFYVCALQKAPISTTPH